MSVSSEGQKQIIAQLRLFIIYILYLFIYLFIYFYAHIFYFFLYFCFFLSFFLSKEVQANFKEAFLRWYCTHCSQVLRKVIDFNVQFAMRWYDSNYHLCFIVFICILDCTRAIEYI